MDIKDYAQMMGYLTRPRDVVPDPSSMVPGPRNMAEGGRLIGKPGGIVEPGIEYYAKTKWVAPNIYKTKAGNYEILYKGLPQVTKKTFNEAKAYLKSIQTPHAQTGVKKSKQHKKATSAGSKLRQQRERLDWIKENPKAFKQMEWISKNGAKYTDPNKMISAFEKRFGYKNFRKADLFKAFEIKPDNSSRINTSFLRESDAYKLIGSDATNPHYISFSKGNTEGEIFRASILQQNKPVQKDMIKAFKLLGEDMGKYVDKAKFNTVEDALKLLGKKEYAVLKNFGFEESGVGRSATRSTMQRLGIDNDTINGLRYIRHPLFNVREIIRNLENDSYRKKWNLSKADATRIINGWKKVEQGYSGANQWIKSVDNKIGEGKFKKIFGNTQFDHTLTKAFGEGYKNVPKDLLLRGKYTSEAFNKLKSSIFDQPLVGLVNKYNKASAADKPGIQKQINNLFKEFNTRTGGHIKEWTPNFTDGKLTFKTSTEPFSDVGRYDNTKLAAKEMERTTLGMKNLGLEAGQYDYSKGQLKNIKKFQLKQDQLKNLLEDLCPNKASGGRIGFNTAGAVSSRATCGARFLEARIKDGKGSVPQRKLMADIIAAGSKFTKFGASMLNPIQLLNPKNWVGPQALALMTAFEMGDITYDTINNNKPIKEALGDNWILRYASPYNREELSVEAVEKAKIKGSPAMQNYMKKVKMEAEYEREFKKLRDLNTTSNQDVGLSPENEARNKIRIEEQQAVVDNLLNEYKQFDKDTSVMGGYGQPISTLESGKKDFEKAYGAIIDKRQGGEWQPGFSDNAFKIENPKVLDYLSSKGIDTNILNTVKTKGEYVNTAGDWADSGDLSHITGQHPYKYKIDLGKDQSRNMSETERKAHELFPFEKGSIRADYTKPTYKDFNYIPQKLPDYLRQEYENEAIKQGMLPPRTSLSEVPLSGKRYTYDLLKNLTELYNREQKAKQAAMYPGYEGTQEPAKYSEGGITTLRSKYEYKK